MEGLHSSHLESAVVEREVLTRSLIRYDETTAPSCGTLMWVWVCVSMCVCVWVTRASESEGQVWVCEWVCERVCECECENLWYTLNTSWGLWRPQDHAWSRNMPLFGGCVQIVFSSGEWVNEWTSEWASEGDNDCVVCVCVCVHARARVIEWG